MNLTDAMICARGGSAPTCSCSPLPSLLLMMRRMRPFFSSATRSVTMPRTSMFCRPPSRPHVSVIFSSTRKWTLDGKNAKVSWLGISRWLWACVCAHATSPY